MDSDSSPSRKRPRENETPSQQHKREQAAERQRRKRMRDRAGGSTGVGMVVFNQGADGQPQIQQQMPPVSQQGGGGGDYPDMSPEEIARRDRVRAAARERQRKHRMLVKQRKMRELGLDMGNEIFPGADEVHFRANADGQYQPVLPHELQQQQPGQGLTGGPEPPFPHSQAHGGQTFATTLLLSFSCAPLLKQHLLRTLNMTNEELASLEPIIANAWDQWDAERRGLHYDQTNGAGGPPGYPVELAPDGGPNGHPYPPPPPGSTDPNQSANEFRARFHRPLVAPSPFQTAAAASAGSSVGTPGSTQDAIDPHLGGVNGQAAKT